MRVIMWRDGVVCMPEIPANSKVYVAGHRGLVGSAIVRHLREKGHGNPVVALSSELDLRNQDAVNGFFSTHQPEYVFLAAAKVGVFWRMQRGQRSFCTTILPSRPM